MLAILSRPQCVKSNWEKIYRIIKASGRATAGTTRAVPDGSTTHYSADRIVVNSYIVKPISLRLIPKST